MKPKIGNFIPCSLRSMFDDHEIEAAGCLLELPRLIAVSEYGPCLPFSWGTKRRRSAYENNNTDGDSSEPYVPGIPMPSSSCPSTLSGRTTTAAATICQRDGGPTINAVDEASSPATPLFASFSPISESDEKPAKRLKRAGRKEELLRILEERMKNNETLKKATRTVTNYYEKLKAYNLCLKARQEELRMGMSKDEPGLEASTSLNSAMNFQQGTPKPAVVVEDHAHHVHMSSNRIHQQLLMTVKAGRSDGYLYPNGQRLCWAASSGGLDSAQIGTTQLIDHKALSRANAAFARQRRKLICKDKNAANNKLFR